MNIPQSKELVSELKRITGEGLRTIALVTLSIVSLFGLPLLLADRDLGLQFILSIPPQAFISVSWLLGMRLSFFRSQAVYLTLTLGMFPIRLAIEAGWYMLLKNRVFDDIFVAAVSGIIVLSVLMAVQTYYMCQVGNMKRSFGKYYE